MCLSNLSGKIADCVTTAYALLYKPYLYEANPFTRYFMNAMGFKGLIIKFILDLILLLISILIIYCVCIYGYNKYKFNVFRYLFYIGCGFLALFSFYCALNNILISFMGIPLPSPY